MPIEEQLLPNKKLKPYYDKVVWLYVCRTFKDTLEDREAQRTHDRFGISSWPHHYLIDPKDDRVLCAMPRGLEAFTATLDRVLGEWRAPAAAALARGRKLAGTLAAARASFKKGDTHKAIAMVKLLSNKPDPFEGWLEARELLRAWQPGEDRRKLADRLADPDSRERAIAVETMALEKKPVGPEAVDRVKGLLAREDEDIVVRVRALRYLGDVEPESVTKMAANLLRVANDPFRYEVLAVVQKHPDPQLEATLVGLFEGAGGEEYPSNNPNVLRIRVAQCLAVCGGTASIDALAKPARECDPRNGLTRIVLQSLAAIGSRTDKRGRHRVTGILIDSLPAPCDVSGHERGSDEGTRRRHLYLVKEVLAALREVTGRGQLPAAPSTWTAKERESLQKQLRRLVGGS